MNLMTLELFEKLKNAIRAGCAAEPFLGVQRQHLDAIVRHCLPQLPLDQGMHQECDVIEEGQRLDARHVLQPNRSKILNGLELLESLFQLRLRFVCGENLARLEIPAVRDQREHPG